MAFFFPIQALKETWNYLTDVCRDSEIITLTDKMLVSLPLFFFFFNIYFCKVNTVFSELSPEDEPLSHLGRFVWAMWPSTSFVL